MTSSEIDDISLDVVDSTTTSTSLFGAINAADTAFNRDLRIAVLIAEVAVGSLGGLLVCLWLWRNCRRRSRINVIILNVTLTDMFVICFACTMQLVWELVDRHWMAGDLMCRLLKWAQSFAIMSSNNMLIVLSVDRHDAIRYPLKKSIPVMTMAGVAYGSAALLSLPQLGVFRQNFVTSEGIFFNKTVCESIFRSVPEWHRQFYLIFVGIIVFYIPLVIIIVCYIRIYLKLLQKAANNRSSSTHGDSSKRIGRSDKVFLQSTRSSSLPRAKLKVLKMTIVIVSTFLVLNLPYHVLEMALSFGYHWLVSPNVMAIFGALAVANSAVNPYVFLLFSVANDCSRCLRGNRLSRRSDEDQPNAETQTSCVQFDSRTPGGRSCLRSSERHGMTEITGSSKRIEKDKQDRPSG